jgi:hypothetical protein
MNFERKLSPLKSMGVGIKVYRCGNCGRYTSEDGSLLGSEERKKVEKIVEEIGDSKTELVHGECCIHEFNRIDEFNRMQVTREMALDAQDPSLEGTWI